MAVTTPTSTPIDIGISQEDRARIAEGLARLLADTSTLYFKTHGYHWNVTGPQFATLHALFEDQYRELWTSVDAIAERIRALGYEAPGSYRALAELSSVPEADGMPSADEMVHDLALGHEQVARTARELVPVVEAAGDQPTLSLLADRLSVHEKTAWMLRASLG
jgi:starvation-inducible DNA-binding protein